MSLVIGAILAGETDRSEKHEPAGMSHETPSVRVRLERRPVDGNRERCPRIGFLVAR